MTSLKDEKITVLAGGVSCEREISLISGRAVCEALRLRGLAVDLLDPTDDFIRELKKRRTTVVFIALHGTFGEDGTVQRMLEEAGIGYTGAGPVASQNAFHKSKSQRIFLEKGISVPPFRVLTTQELDGMTSSPIAYPVVVKPSAAGSSVGVSLVSDKAGFKSACVRALGYSDQILVERYVRGRELTVGILEDEPLPIVEIIAQRDFYDYEAKYGDSGTRYECPANLEEGTAKLVAGAAMSAARALGCELMSRADFILSGDGQAYLLELNTIPGLTGKSLLPKAAKAAGIDFPDLCVKIIELSSKKRSMAWLNR